jgi:hypothetical protein
MASTADSELDRIAEQAVEDLRQLSALWREQGSAALDAAMRRDPAWVFAVIDGRRGSEGFVRLLARRSPADSDDASLEVVFSFGLSATGERIIVARWCDAYVRLHDARIESAAAAPAGMRLAEELAWRLEIGLDDPASVRLPADFDRAPELSRQSLGGWVGEAGLLRTLDQAARMLDGRLPCVAGAVAIQDDLWRWGYESSAFYTISSAFHDIEYEARVLAFREREAAGSGDAGTSPPPPSREEQLARLDIWAREVGGAECVSLIDRFQGPAFAEAEVAGTPPDRGRA